MGTKIRTLQIKGIRGAKEALTLNLAGKSILIYGDNGTGKSSITDAIEWVYKDSIKHLSDEEIGRKGGKEALRNLLLSDRENAHVEICYTNTILDCNKAIKSDLKSTITNTSSEYEVYMRTSYSENLILRYSELVEFIIAKKKAKLDRLQEIIGFSEVGSLRDLLKSNAGRIKREINTKGFDNKKSAKQSIILENLGTNAYTQEQFFKAVNELIEPLGLDIKIASFNDIKVVLKKIENKDDLKIAEEISFLTRVYDNMKELEGSVDSIGKKYKKYYEDYTKLRKSPEKINKLQLLDLLNEGVSVLEADVIKENYCPLCRQEKNKLQLIRDLNRRIDELETLEEEKQALEEKQEELSDIVDENIRTIDSLLKDKNFKEDTNSELLKKIRRFKTFLTNISIELEKDLLAKDGLAAPTDLTIDKKPIKDTSENLSKALKKLNESQKKNVGLRIHSNLKATSIAYFEYLQIEKEQEILRKQQITFENLYADFIRRQEEALNIFLNNFSKDIDAFYTAMNPKEGIKSIQLAPLKDKNEDLVGITIEYEFFDSKRNQPIAYLSESHINCLGLSFFLASVRAFNKENEFFILDDVVSSFDRKHRARFAKLLMEQFEKHQILLLTHEKEFFELVASDAKNKGWSVQQLEWSLERGTVLEKAKDIREKIEKKIKEKNTDGLGNDVRIYTEKVLKEIALNIEAPVPFRYNMVNEKRMAPELLDSIQRRIADKSLELKKQADIPKIKGMPMFIGNTSSHHNEFQSGIDDYEVMWEEINRLINAFYCNHCKKYLSISYVDPVKNRIRCGCKDEKLNYDWKN